VALNFLSLLFFAVYLSPCIFLARPFIEAACISEIADSLFKKQSRSSKICRETRDPHSKK